MTARLLSTLRRPAALALALPLIAGVTPQASQAAADKLDRIARSALESGETIVLSEDELNSFLRYDGAAGIPPGIDDVAVRLRDGGATIDAVVDPEAAGASLEDAPLFIRLLASGARKVSADIVYEAGAGAGAARVAAVRIEDFTLSGDALDWFLAALAPEPLRPYLAGRPIPLASGIDAVRIAPGRIVLTAK